MGGLNPALILTQKSLVENEYDESIHLSFFHFFEAFNDAFEAQFLGLHFYTFIKDTDTDSTTWYGHAAQKF